jgi:rSAM/selenodomain-associated transferase 1
VSVSRPPGREESIALIVAKAPLPGRAKTRLATAIGPTQAAALARAMLLDTLEGCRREVPIVGVLCASPDEVELLVELAGPGAPVVVQEGSGLSSALREGVRHSLDLGSIVLLVSSDIPGVPAGALHDAVCLLGEGVDVVLGPGYDGGYWLIGVREQHPGLFDDIPWSTTGVLEATLVRCRDLSLETRLLDPWRDIDTIGDGVAVADRIETLPGRRTAEALARLTLPGRGRGARLGSKENQDPITEEVPTL